MGTKIFHTIFLTLFLLCGRAAFAQQTVPKDAAIETGMLGNGLTYILVNNPNAKDGFADFHFVQKSGTAAEGDDEKGMTRLLCCQSLFQTRNFPDGEVMRFVNNQGMVASKEMLLRVQSDEVVFSMTNVPIEVKPQTLDSALLVFYNFASGANLFSETMESGRMFYRQLYAMWQSSPDRADVGIVNAVFPSSSYVQKSYTDETEAVERYSSLDLRRFHRRWFCSGRQALVIVGDIDVTSVKGKINTLFQALPRYSAEEAVSFPEPPLRCGTREVVAIVDKEASVATLTVNFVLPLLPDNLRGTSASMVSDYFNALVSNVLEKRVRDMVQKTDIPLISFSTKTDGFAGISRVDNFAVEMQTSPDMVNDGLVFLSGVIEGMMNGISPDEFKYAADEYYYLLQHYSKKSERIENEFYTDECILHFLKGTPIPSIAVRKEMLSKMRNTFGVNDLNSYIRYRFGDEPFVVVSAVSPKKITEKNIGQSYQKGRMVAREPAPADMMQRPNTASAADPIPTGMKTKTSEEHLTKSVVYTLPNGVTVVVKSTDVEPGKVSLLAVAKGGLSRAKGNYDALRQRVGYVAELTAPPCPDSLDISLKKEFSESLTALRGECESDNLKDLLRQVRRHFNDYAIENEAIGSYRMYCIAESERFLMNSPENRFVSMMNDYIKVREDENGHIDYESILKFIDDSFTNVSDFTFFIVGDVKADKVKGMCEQFLGTLESNPYRRSSVRDGIFYIDDYSAAPNVAAVPMEVPRWFHNIKFSTAISYDLKGLIMSYFIARTLEMKASDLMIQEGIITVAKSDFQMFPSENMTVDFSFITADDSGDYERILTDLLDELAVQGVSERDFQLAKNSVMVEDALWENDKTDYWMVLMVNRYIFGKDFYTQRRETMNGISYEEFNTALRNAVGNGSRMITRVVPKGNVR